MNCLITHLAVTQLSITITLNLECNPENKYMSVQVLIAQQQEYFSFKNVTYNNIVTFIVYEDLAKSTLIEDIQIMSVEFLDDHDIHEPDGNNTKLLIAVFLSSAIGAIILGLLIYIIRREIIKSKKIENTNPFIRDSDSITRYSVAQ